MEILTLLLVVFIMSSVTVLAVMLVKKLLGDRVSPYFHYLIWMILIVRLLFPILPQSNISIHNIFTEHIKISRQADISPLSSSDTEVNTTETGITQENTASPEPIRNRNNDVSYTPENIGGIKAKPYENIRWNLIAAVIYITVTAALITALVIEYHTNKRMLIMSSVRCTREDILNAAHDMALSLGIRGDIPIYIGRKSLTYGCFDRFIIIDCHMSDSYEMILAHELTHLKRRDNLMNILIAVLRRIYWFNPIVAKGLDMISTDMELVCDHQALERFRLRKDEYAMLLYKSVTQKTSDEIEPKLVSAASMSSAGKQLIRRLNYINRTGRTKLMTMIVSIILLCAVMTSCLTNPMLTFEQNDSKIYMNHFASMAAAAGTSLPSANDKVTASGFIDMMILALDSLDLPGEVRTRLNVFKDGGAEVFYDKLCAEYTEYRPAVVKNFLEAIDLDSGVSKQQAAFLMNHMLIYLGRDNIFQTDETDEVDPRLYVPTYVQRDEIESLCEAILASGQENAEMTAKKLNAFYAPKTYDDIPTENFKTGQPLTEEEIEQMKLELQQIFPIVDAFETYVYDPYATRRENNLIAGYFKSVAGFNYTDTQSLHGMANYPTMLPYFIGEDSYEKNLIGTITDKVLKAEIEAAYIHDEAREVYTLDTTLDAQLLKNLGSRLARNSSYSYEQMHSDHSINGFTFIDGVSGGRLTLDDIYPSPEELPESFRDDESYLFDKVEYTLKVMTVSAFEKLLGAIDGEYDKERVKAFYTLKDPSDPNLQPRGAAEMKLLWGEFGEEGVYIADPYMSKDELARLEEIIGKALNTELTTTVYSMPVREYTGYKDDIYIHDYAINSIKELVRFGIIDDGGRLNPNGSLKYSDAAEMVTKFTASLIAY